MKKLLQVIYLTAALIGVATPAHAIFTACTANKDIELAIMPNGPTERHFRSVDKGDEVDIRNGYKNWFYVAHATYDDEADYGWVRQSDLSNCHEIHGTE